MSKTNPTNSSRSLPQRPIDRMAVRAALIAKLGLERRDSQQLDKRALEYIEPAKTNRRKVLKDLTSRAQYYKLPAYITAATLLLSEDGARQLRAACLRQGVTVRGKMPLLRFALKAFGPYDYNSPERRRSADKRLSRDFHALEFATRRGVIPTSLMKFFGTPGNGLDECSRGKSLNMRSHIGRAISADDLAITGTASILNKIRSLKAGDQFMARVRFTGSRLEFNGTSFDAADVTAIASFARQLEQRKRPASVTSPHQVLQK
jgi:hypothetical protein